MTSRAKQIEQIWFENPSDFLTNKDNIIKFIPDSKMTLTEQLNAAFRFALYFSIIVAIIRRDSRVLFFAIFVGAFTIAVHYNDNKALKIREGLMQELNLQKSRNNEVCIKPTKENPYMNVLVSDYDEFPNRPKACNVNNKDVKASIRENSNNVHQDVDDIFDRRVNDRQFYTNPITTIPNAQGEFAHWLYNNGVTCKERTGTCKPRF